MEAATAEFHRRYELRAKALTLQPLSGRGGWTSIVNEPYTGAWQRNTEIRMDTALSFSAVFACTTLMMSDTGKTCLRLVEKTGDDIWVETENPAYSPVLRRPNRYQSFPQFVETWVASLLNSGNTYVLKQRDGRNVVIAMYGLDPSRVTPLVAQDGSVFYQLKRDDISGLPTEVVTVPASEIIHDRINCLFHPLIGLSPLYACSTVVAQGLAIQNNSSSLFGNKAIPGGILTTPNTMSDETAQRLTAYWNANFTGSNAGKTALLSDGLHFEPMAWNAVDLQLVEQLKLSAETICSAYHVPPYLVNIGPPPPYANVEPLIQSYYSQNLQARFKAIEDCLDNGLGLGNDFGNDYGTEFDPDDLIWMDSAAKSKAAQDGIGSGAMSPNEARRRYFGLAPVKGGDTPYLQQQYWPLQALSERDIPVPTAQGSPAPVNTTPQDMSSDGESMDQAAMYSAILRKSIAEGWYVA